MLPYQSKGLETFRNSIGSVKMPHYAAAELTRYGIHPADAAQVLRLARDKIANEDRWVKGHFALRKRFVVQHGHTFDYEPIDSRKVTNPDMMCAVGAVENTCEFSQETTFRNIVGFNEQGYNNKRGLSVAAVCVLDSTVRATTYNCLHSTTEFNDLPDTAHADVMALFGAAIRFMDELAEEQEPKTMVFGGTVEQRGAAERVVALVTA